MTAVAAAKPSVTAATLHEVKRTSNDIAAIELIVAYRDYAAGYYKKNGQITREVGMIDDSCRVLRRWLNERVDQQGRPLPAMLADEFGPIALVRETSAYCFDPRDSDRQRRELRWCGAS